MNLEDRVAAFEKLGKYISAIDEVEFSNIAQHARNENSWFTAESIRQAFSGISKFLDRESLSEWLSHYNFSGKQSRVIAVVMAGNIPLVGFHDLLCILISGNAIQIKPSSKDTFLLKHILQKLIEFEPRFASLITLNTDQLKNFDAVIATGSDNSARYFHYYFAKYPHVIRKNRTSCAILSGFETQEELTTLGADVFSYFGLGCRNVSKIYVPEEYDFIKLLKSWEPHEHVLMHHKYHNNYDYQKSILLVNRVPFLDSGFVILQENERLVSPISVVYYEYYKSWENVLKRLDDDKDKIQCVIGNVKPATIKIGQAQSPELWDYADQIDILRFLEQLN
jgi:hypothetical protein